MIEYKVGINFRECAKIGRSVVGRTPNKCVERRQYNRGLLGNVRVGCVDIYTEMVTCDVYNET